MRKAFDANVPKLRPRLRGNGIPGAEVAEEEGLETPASPVSPAPTSARSPAPPAAEPVEEHLSPAHKIAESLAAKIAAEPAEVFGDVTSRRERLEKIKRRVAEAARPRPRVEPPPETPGRAAESALGLVRDLESQLSRSRDVEEALRADLEAVRAELSRGAAEVRSHAERLSEAERQVEEKRQVLAELLGEMGALEEERDRAVERAQALAALDEERQAVLDALSGRVDAAEKARDATREEAARLAEDLDARAAEGARLRAALAEVTRERDDLAREVDKVRRERDELSDARRALEQVHQALATARSRLG